MKTIKAKRGPSGPSRPCLFIEGQLVTCPGPFNSGCDAEGYWRRVDAVSGLRWDGPIGRWDTGFWRVAVPGYSGPDTNFSPAPEGAKVGDIIRLGRQGS